MIDHCARLLSFGAPVICAWDGSAEYQVCHTRFEDRYHKLRFKLGLGHLLLSTVTSTLLFLHLLPNFASLLSSLIMLLTIVMNALNLAVMEGDHKRYRKKFSKLKMKIASVLLMEPGFALRDRFPVRVCFPFSRRPADPSLLLSGFIKA